MNGLITNCPGAPAVGFVIFYQCTRGYILQGNSSRECLLGGNWTGADPTCSSKFTNVDFVYVIQATKIRGGKGRSSQDRDSSHLFDQSDAFRPHS